MSLPHFIHESLDDILAEWERDCGAASPRAEPVVRRQHFGKVLRAVADEMKRLPATASTASAAAPSHRARRIRMPASWSATTRRCARP